MSDFALFVTRNDGPVSPTLPVQVTSISRAVPFASQGLPNVPSPLDPSGQGRVGFGAAALGACVAGGDADGAGADGGVTATVLVGAPAFSCPWQFGSVIDRRTRGIASADPARC